MNGPFDPYHKWLGIPAREQPPNHYRLLGLALFEVDYDAIQNAADQRMILLRSFQTGPRAKESQRLLNEVAAARVCLVDSAARLAYDTQLRAQIAAIQPPDAEPDEYSLAPVETPAADMSFILAAASPPAFSPAPPAAPRKSPQRPKNAVVEGVKIVVGGFVGLVAGYFIVCCLRPSFDTLHHVWQKKVAEKTPDSPNPSDPISTPPTPLTPSAPPAPPAIVENGPTKSPAKPPDKPTTPDITSSRKVAGAPVADEIVTTTWNNNDQARPLIKNTEGFAFATSAGGYFLGNGEWFGLSLNEAQTWELRGSGAKPIECAAGGVKSRYRTLFQPSVEEVRWTRGKQPVELIHSSDGFAVLAGVRGCFLGPEHEARVYIDPDGYWYVSGRTNFDSAAAAHIYRFKEPHAFRATVQEKEWRRGQPPVQMLHKDEGICFLSSISGAFRGAGEQAGVHVDERGYWVLSGRSGQDSLLARAIAIKFARRTKLPEIEIARTDPSPAVVGELPVKQAPMPSDADRTAAAAKVAPVLESKDVKKILAAADEAKTGAERYALLAGARDVAIVAGSTAETMAAIDQLGESFKIDIVKEKAAAIRALRTIVTSKAESEVLSKTALEVCQAAEVALNSEVAKEMALIALTAARKAQNDTLVRMATLHLIDKPK